MHTDTFLNHHKNLRTGKGVVLENAKVAEQTWIVAIDAPELAAVAEPGQFVMLRLPETISPLLGRPFAIYSANRETGEIQIGYLTVGRMTNRLTRVAPGESLEWWGPLGKGWKPIEGKETDSNGTLPFKHLVMTAGGIGYTPFHMLAEEYAQRKNPPKLTLLYGARNKSRLANFDSFKKLGVDTRIATDDGSAGHKGFVSDLIPDILANSGFGSKETMIVACGPKPMLASVFKEAERLGKIPCYVSLETPMSCGLGLCFGCVVEYLDDKGGKDYRRTCVDGPAFDAYRLVW